jgi:hypothetical protein
LVPESITTSATVEVSNFSNVKLAIKNFEESIEVTRQQSSTEPASSSRDRREPSGLPTPQSLSSTTKSNKNARNRTKKARNAAKGSDPVVSAATTNGIPSQSSFQVNDAVNAPEQEAYRGDDATGLDETTITSTSSNRSPSFDSSTRHSLKEDLGAFPRFEVLLDEISEKAAKPSKAAVGPSEEAKNVSVEKLANVARDTSHDGRQKGFEIDFSPKEDLPDFSVNPKVVVNKKNRKARRNRQRQLSTTARSTATSEDPSNLFFSAIDNHVATRKPRRIPKLFQSVEVVKSSKVKEDVVVMPTDTITLSSDNSSPRKLKPRTDSHLLSPSTAQAAREIPSITAAPFAEPPLPKSNSIRKKKYSIQRGELVVEVVEVAIEVKDTGSVIVEQSHGQNEEKKIVSAIPSTIKFAEESVKKPYRLVRMENPKPRSKTPTRSLIAKGFRRKMKRSKNSSASPNIPRNPIKVFSDEGKTDAIELLRAHTNVGSSNTFSYDENEEDNIIKRVSPPPSPFPNVENLQIVGVANDIEVVFPSSKQGMKSPVDTIPLTTDVLMDRIVSIRKLSSQDESSTNTPIKILSQDPSSLSNETSSPPKKFVPVIEIPSNRVEEHAFDVTRAASYSTKSAGSIHSISSSKPSGESSTGHITPNPHQMKTTIETEGKGPKNGDQLVYISGKQSSSEIAKAVVVPKLPAPKKDTLRINADLANNLAGNTDEKSSPSRSRKVKIQVQNVQKPDGNVKNIEISSVATDESYKSESKVSSLVKKYSAMVVKNQTSDQPSIEEKSSASTVPSESNYVVRVNVLGVAGIVVARKNCRDFTGNDRSPSPPEQIAAVVGISESGQESIDNVTTFSGALIHAPNMKVKNEGEVHDEGQRHIAVWASEHQGESPGSVVDSNMLKIKPNGPNLFLDLNVALARSGEGIHHTAVVIGTASVEITKEMIRASNIRTIDLPVHQVGKEGPLLVDDSSRVILLRTASKQRNDIRKFCVEQLSDRKEDRNKEDLASAYAIDPKGDSMIRIQVRVEEVHVPSKQEKIKRSGSFTERTAATERSDESSIPSNSSQKQMKEGEMYSKPLEHHFDDGASFHTVSRKEELVASNEAADDEAANDDDVPGCKVFGKKISLFNCTSTSKKGLASQIDDRIDDMAEKFFSATCTNQRDDSSLGHQSGITSSTAERKMFEEMKSVLGPVPSMTELRCLAQEIALSGGEYFFPNKARDSNEGAVQADDDDNTSVESATLLAIEPETLRKRSKESWTKKRDDDDVTYSTGGSENESEASFPLNHTDFGEEPIPFIFNGKRRVMSENNKFDLDTGKDQKGFGASRTFGSFPEGAAQLDVGCEGDDEGSSEERTPLADQADEVVEENDKEDHDLKRQSSGKPSLPSVVENIAEVLSIGGKACGYFSEGKIDPGRASPVAIWNRSTVAKEEVEIPKTVDQSDLQSVGELTAITLEKDEIKEKNRKLLMKKLGLPKEILAWSTGGKSKASAGDAEESQEQKLGDSDEAVSERPELYFLEYEESENGVRSIYGGSDVPKKDVTVEEAQRLHVDSPLSNVESNPESSLRNIKEADEVESV